METSERKIHQGRNVKRFREMLGMKQEALAYELGDDWNQKKISLLEAKEEIEPQLLEEVAKALKVPREAIENFDEEKAFNVISNTFHNNSHDNSSIISSAVNFQPTFNVVDKLVEVYERLLQAEKEKNELLQTLRNKK